MYADVALLISRELSFHARRLLKSPQGGLMSIQRLLHAVWLCLLVALVFSSHSFAQDDQQDTNVAATEQPSAPTPETGPAPAAGTTDQATAKTNTASSTTKDDPKLNEARERIRTAQNLYEQGNFDAALVEFLRARLLIENHPARHLVDYNIGRCYEKLFRYDQAMEFYQRYLDNAGADANDAEEVRAKIESLMNLLGTLEISADVDAYALWIDGHHVGDNISTALVPGGSHVVEVRADGYMTKQLEVMLPARETRKLEFHLIGLAEEYRGISPAYFWTSTLLTVGAAGASAVFGLQAMQRKSDFEDALSQGGSTAIANATPEERDDINQLALMSDIFLGSAVLLGITTIILGVMTDWEGDEESQNDTMRVRLMPAIGEHEAGLVLGGSF